MDIQGLQKLTLLDFPGRTACTVFLSGCDFRCPFCHNSELIPRNAPQELDSDALLAFLEKRKGILDGVAFTGGEPLMRKELPELFREIRAIGYPIKLDTNGNHPDTLRSVLEEGLVDYVAMDIKNSPERYAETAGLRHLDLDNINESIQLLLHSTIDYEFRTTTMAELHDESSFQAIGSWIRGAKNYYIQSFTDRDTVVFSGFHAPSLEELHHYLDVVSPMVQHAELRGSD